MDIEIISTTSGETLKIKGRLDAQWADHLGRTLEDIIRQGRHYISLDASGIDYISSAGIRVLLIYFRRLKGIGGRLAVVDPSPQVQQVLSMSGLHILLTEDVPSVSPAAASERAFSVEPEKISGIKGRFEVVCLDETASLKVSAVGRPDAFIRGVEPGECRTCAFPARRFGLGLGAFGNAGGDCRNRLGEFLAVSGMTACLPVGGTTPDYHIGAGDYIPEVLAAYGLVGEGGFSHLIRFEAGTEVGGVGLAEITATCLQILGKPTAGLAIVGENAGLVGASLRSLSQDTTAEDFFAHPAVRHRLTFTAERAFSDHVSVVTGFAARDSVPLLDPFLRPLLKDSNTKGHFHAAVFSYRPLPKNILEPGPFVTQLFKEERLQGLLHLLADERPIIGIGESEWVRGLCWASLVDSVSEGAPS